MAGKVFFSVTMSLDGFIAPKERMDNGRQRQNSVSCSARALPWS